MGFRCRLFGCSEVNTWQGYDAYRTKWTVLSHCTRCGKQFRTIDDLFVGTRPDHFPIEKSFGVAE